MRTAMTARTTGSQDQWSYAEYARLPDDGNRYEVIDGEVLVTPAPSTGHQHVVGRLYRRIIEYVEAHGLGYVLFDVDVLFVTGQFLRPDLVFIPKGGREGLTDRGVEVPPGLIVEVLSPSSRSIDLVRKPARYGDFGVPVYWVVDPAESVVHEWDFRESATAVRHEQSISWQPDPAIAPLVIRLDEVFRPL
jgi:Uma2 family endonuclease